MKLNMQLKVDDNYSVTTTVSELIKELSKFDGDLLVYTEGCDCIGNVVSVRIDSGYVLIEMGFNEFEFDLDSDEPPKLNEPYKSMVNTSKGK